MMLIIRCLDGVNFSHPGSRWRLCSLKLFREVVVESDSSAIKSFQLFEYFLLANITLVMQVFFLWSFSSQ